MGGEGLGELHGPVCTTNAVNNVKMLDGGHRAHRRGCDGITGCETRAHPQRKPAPNALLVSRPTDTEASLSVSRSTAAARASKSPLFSGNTPARG